MPIRDTEPRYLWNAFDDIRKIPRPSKKEEKIRRHLLEWAKGHGFDASADDTGNVVVRVPATAGHEGAPTVIIQSHMDMVCEKNNDRVFDFDNDPIELEIQGDWLTAKGTTLGADNGVGLAAGLAAAEDPDVVHGPLELLITVDEETGLTGAAELDSSMLTGKTLLNLDTEELHSICIGCAGGGDSTLTLPINPVGVPGDVAMLHIKVGGLQGGHSGMDIKEQRGNAIKSLARILWQVGLEHQCHMVRFDGGGVHNAIPREAVTDVVVSAADADAVSRIIRNEAETIRAELGKVDPGLTVEVSAVDELPEEMMDTTTHARVINLLLTIPHGVDTMSNDVPGLVETSNNLASVWTRDGNVIVGTSSRSSVGSALEAMRDRIRAAGYLAGAEVEENNAYPGWKPDISSKVLGVVKKAFKTVHGKEPVIEAVHAGLECGIIGDKIAGMDMVSFGPTIEMPHSPDERVNIPSVVEFWKVFKLVLKDLATPA